MSSEVDDTDYYDSLSRGKSIEKEGQTGSGFLDEKYQTVGQYIDGGTVNSSCRKRKYIKFG